jgi:aspartyl-tRNA(Asn)/glutamyl-tRNA(Gln) amidotransferase subunit B
MRVKEGESDYRYFPEPDIPPMTLDSTTVKAWADTLVELPAQKRQRYVLFPFLSFFPSTLCTVDTTSRP